MDRRVPALFVAAAATIPTAGAWATQSAFAASKHTKKHTVTTRTYKGPLVDMRWGPVQAVIKVKGKKIASVKIVTNPENQRSLFIDEQAVPMLKQETMQTQNAAIDLISGATMTSEAYVLSLRSALKKAHLKTG